MPRYSKVPKRLKTPKKNMRRSRQSLVTEYLGRILSGKPTKRIEKRLEKTKEGQRLKAELKK